MKKILMLLSVALLASVFAPASNAPLADTHIADAILAASEERRADAGVLGYKAAGPGSVSERPE